jgi:hypothetical protein
MRFTACEIQGYLVCLKNQYGALRIGIELHNTMTTQETVYIEIERPVKNFKDMPRENPSTMMDAIGEMRLETRSK